MNISRIPLSKPEKTISFHEGEKQGDVGWSMGILILLRIFPFKAFMINNECLCPERPKKAILSPSNDQAIPFPIEGSNSYLMLS